MKESLKTIMQPFENTIVIDRSEFITSLFPTETADEAKLAIESIRKKHYSATHHCSAYIIGLPITIQKTNDDGEPKGTAGIPMLQSLTYKNMTNITAIVTRYFGGIKLGAGGLIRAYAGSVTAALSIVQLATYEHVQQYQLEITYEELNHVYFLEELHKNFSIINLEYDQQIVVIIECLSQNFEDISNQFTAQFFRKVLFTCLSEVVKKFPVADLK